MALWRRSLRASFGIGLVFGLAFFVPLLSWLVNVAWYAWVALAIAEAVIFAVLAVGQRLLLRLPAWPLAVAGWWVAAEALRGRWPYAFPWGRLAMSQAGSPTAPWAAIGGAPLLSFLVALAGATLAWALLRPRAGGPRPRCGAWSRPGWPWPGRPGWPWRGALLPVDQPAPGSRSADGRRHPGQRAARPEPAGPAAGHHRHRRTTRPPPRRWPPRSPRAAGPPRTW